MATTEQTEAVKAITPIVVDCCKKYGYKFPSAIIAQMCHEGFTELKKNPTGISSLASEHHNWAGMKCGSTWKGASVNYKTFEFYNGSDVSTPIRDNFRSYPTLEDGIEGYFDFIKYSRYKNLKDCVSPSDYLRTIALDGWCTAAVDGYVKSSLKWINEFQLSKYDLVTEDKSGYYPKWEGDGYSIITALQECGETDTSFSHRKAIYAKNFGTAKYCGEADENLKMVKLIKSGELLKV